MQKILVTGATGYIGSHTWVELLNAGYEVIGVDNFINSRPVVLERIASITGRKLNFVEGDLCNPETSRAVFEQHDISSVIHFAALKAVGESVQKPLAYYANNLNSLLTVCENMGDADVERLVFSSSATVYGEPASVPITEDFPLSATNPYGMTKLVGEQILRDLELSDPSWKIAYLRYFNPVGAHESGLIGENPLGTPNNLMPYIAQVANGRLEKLSIYGNDYPTPDGTGVRDYIHVVDLAKAHIAGLRYLENESKSITANIGTGVGYSVMEMVAEYARVSGREIPFDLVARRSGDIAVCYADPTLAKTELKWQAEKSLQAMCEDSWRWQSNC
ncbi:MAG: UDP-glucose 4-epimerase GalE [Herminiimonas sp.]|uniref:UDP-glucose 4-epimerase GalE n=1 Tax=Herminiimonas sp. TaxID=1926289 RepID=UPI00271E9A9E|nr:UDP-glucose 4-epimerase GalE [Herminiimonas sp.]MDO9420298.1 UDP-glucose 4-epimerase GalE [Herminiimonas sp.]